MSGFAFGVPLESGPSFTAGSAPTLQQSLSNMQPQSLEMPSMLREFDDLYPTLDGYTHSDILTNLSDVAGAKKADTNGDDQLDAKKMEEVAEAGDGNLLDSLRRKYKASNTKLETMEWELKNFMPPLTEIQRNAFNDQITNLLQEFTTLQRELDELLDRVLLVPLQLALWKKLCSFAEFKITQIEIYKSEVQALWTNKYPPEGLGALLITSQPFPDVVKQKEKKRTKGHTNYQEDPIEVKLLSGARSGLVVSGKVQAELVWESQKDQDTKGSNFILNGTAAMKKQGVASFDDLRFSKGTGVKAVQVSFSCKAKAPSTVNMPGAKQEFILESNLTAPFIVMTNESQFSDSAFKVLEYSIFGSVNMSVSWLRFCNVLQMHYLTSTRQHLEKIIRPLTKADLAYIWKLKFQQAKEVSRDVYGEFWKWFGKLVHVLRHQKPVPELWEKGLIFGFISKDAASDILANHAVGTFLIRFSEQSAGQFAVAVVAKGKEVGTTLIKHMLVPPETKKLSDWVKTKDSLKTLVLCNFGFKVDNYPSMCKGVMAKDGAFGDFYTEKGQGNQIQGYDDLQDSE